MEMTERKSRGEYALQYIGAVSPECRREISEIIKSSSEGLEEIRLRAEGVSSVRLFGKDYYLLARLQREETEAIFDRLCGGALYAHRDSIRDGYVTAEGGIRIGVAGRASYDGGVCVGIGEITSLVFRIPSGVCNFGEELYERWCSGGRGGMLIISPPGGGKTTALRALAGYIGREKRTIVADERCEFDPGDYRGTSVDILRGYKRASGIEIAARTMSPEVIMCDEIFTDGDTEALLGALGAGVTVVATAHGTDLAGIKKRRCIRTLIDEGMFSSLVTVIRDRGGFSYKYEELA